ncbi:MAG: hypothetical protein CMD25_05345 [Flavobacteriales bacterium]|nr:hypothetical protein [Flavobacteriales bacterium]
MTKQDKVLNYLTRGKTLSQDSAYSMFEVGNLRATISDIKPALKKSGFTVVRSTGRQGETRYGASKTRRRATSRR